MIQVNCDENGSANESSTTNPMIPGTTTISWGWVGFPEFFNNKKNPHVPENIYVNPDTGTLVVKWADGKETHEKCQPGDAFSIEVGFALALMHRIFGETKTQFKKKWYKVIFSKARMKWNGENYLNSSEYFNWSSVMAFLSGKISKERLEENLQKKNKETSKKKK